MIFCYEMKQTPTSTKQKLKTYQAALDVQSELPLIAKQDETYNKLTKIISWGIKLNIYFQKHVVSKEKKHKI